MMTTVMRALKDGSGEGADCCCDSNGSIWVGNSSSGRQLFIRSGCASLSPRNNATSAVGSSCRLAPDWWFGRCSGGNRDGRPAWARALAARACDRAGDGAANGPWGEGTVWEGSSGSRPYNRMLQSSSPRCESCSWGEDVSLERWRVRRRHCLASAWSGLSGNSGVARSAQRSRTRIGPWRVV